jgi:hypothetical protein
MNDCHLAVGQGQVIEIKDEVGVFGLSRFVKQPQNALGDASFHPPRRAARVG